MRLCKMALTCVVASLFVVMAAQAAAAAPAKGAPAAPAAAPAAAAPAAAAAAADPAACNLATKAARGKEDYGEVLTLSYLFYEAQQSGKLPDWNRVRHDKPCGWRRDAHLDDGKASNVGKDLSGGYYDAGDYLKCAHPLAWTLANLALGALEFPEGYKASGNYPVAVNHVKAMADWLLKAHLEASDDPAKNVFVGQVSARPDHWYFGRPEHSKVKRVVYTASKDRPGADLAAEYAAGFAAAAVLMRQEGKAEYAATLFKHAKQAYAFAKAYPKNWETPEGVFQAYKSFWPQGYLGQMTWAAAWMCRYDKASCADAAKYWGECMKINNVKYALGYDWDTVLPGAAALLVAGKVEPVADEAAGWLEGYILAKWQDAESECPKESYANVCYTKKGLAYYADWGTLRGTANAAFIAALMSKYGGAATKDAHACWAASQLSYMLGTSEKNSKSYLIGYGGEQAATRPHHRGAACARTYTGKPVYEGNGTCTAGETGAACCNVDGFMAPADSRVLLKGALVGGPDQSDEFPNVRNDYKRSEVALDYQAGFTGAAAALAGLQKRGDLAKKCAALPGAAGGKALKRVADYSFCGGKGDMCPPELNGKCADAPWPGYKCAPGQVCVRKNEWAHMCVGAVPQ